MGLLTWHSLQAENADLARENADLRAMVADLWDESRAFAAGVEAGRGEVLAWVEGDGQENVIHSRCADEVVRHVRALGPARPPLRPHALEAEAARLREALRALVDNARDRGHVCPEKMLDNARAALGEAP